MDASMKSDDRPEEEPEEESRGRESNRACSECGAAVEDLSDRELQVELLRELRAMARQDAIDDLAEDVANDWRAVMEPALDPVFKLLERSETAGEFRQGLKAALDSGDAEPLLERLAVAMFKARGVGDATDDPRI